jgi:hypothetical protein
MKKPFFRWLLMSATSIVPRMPPAASGVSRPSASSTPAPSSVRVANTACTRPGRMPIDSNQRAVPGSLPPPNAWFHPWAMRVAPTAMRRIRPAMATLVTRCSRAAAVRVRRPYRPVRPAREFSPVRRPEVRLSWHHETTAMAEPTMTQPPEPLDLLAAGVPLTLLYDLADDEGPDSGDIASHEPGNADWLDPYPAPDAESSGEQRSGS